MDAAIRIAQTGRMVKCIGCVITQKGPKGRIVSCSSNFPMGTVNCAIGCVLATCHAEMGALEKLLRDLHLLEQARCLLTERVRDIPKPHKKGGKHKRKQSKATRSAQQRSPMHYDMYVVHTIKDGRNLGCAKPCSECTRWLQICTKLGVHIRVWYSDFTGHKSSVDDDTQETIGNSNTQFFDQHKHKPHEYKLPFFIW